MGNNSPSVSRRGNYHGLFRIIEMTGTYERIAERLLVGQPKPKPFGLFDGKRFWTGTKSLHRTAQSRRWRLFWRLKQRRQTI
jgi:hypothetical protein